MHLTFDDIVKATGARVAKRGSATQFDGVSTDSRAISQASLFVALVGEKFDAHDFVAQAVTSGAGALLVKAGRVNVSALPDVPIFEVPDTLVALGALGRFHRDRFSIPIGAVTGSNGKTTTKELIGAILETRGPALKTQGNLNNEIGVPLTLFGLNSTHVAAIVEMGMNHAGEISRLTQMARPDAGLITIVQPAHLEGLGSIDGVARAKGELFHGLPEGATAVVNLDDARIVAQAKQLKAKTLTFGRSSDAAVQLVSAVDQGAQGQLLSIRADARTWEVPLKLVGAHNAMNATGAFALALSLGYRSEECVAGLSRASAHARRLQLKPGLHGVTVLDDCYNANPSSMTAALQTLETLSQRGRAIAVLGDMLELGADETEAHATMGRTAAKHAKLVAFFGTRMKHAWASAQQQGLEARQFDDVAALTQWLQPQLRAGDTVLVKGSRGMRLERVVDALTGQTSQGAH